MAQVVGNTIVPGIPLWAYDAWVARGVDWLVMSEDLPRAENRVTVESRRPHPALRIVPTTSPRISGWCRKRSAFSGASASGWS